MYRCAIVVLLVSIGVDLAFAACSDTPPNGTATQEHYFPCFNGPITFHSARPAFVNNDSYEYPIHLSYPVRIHASITNTGKVYTDLRETINVWKWGGFVGCQWTPVPTLGLLDNLNGCEHGIPCPIATGDSDIVVIFDFTSFGAIIHLLTDGYYQLDDIIKDHTDNDREISCLSFQSMARIN